MSSRYVFDKDNFKVRRDRPSFGRIFRRCLKYFVASIALAVIYYAVFALFFSTDTERRLRHENRMYEKLYPEMEEKEALLGDVVDELQARDNGIYEEIFHSSPLFSSSSSSAGYADFISGADTIPDEDIVRYSEEKLRSVEAGASEVTRNLRHILDRCMELRDSLPPLNLPLRDFSVSQTGASVGGKINPFYKVEVRHDGLDLIAVAGTPVYATADGVVTDVVRSKTGQGNVVTIDHGNGFVTRYAHLQDILVRKGRRLEKGDRIGSVGMSGKSFAPHLHYEVIRDTVVADPLNHFFADLTPGKYLDMMILGTSIAQSMD